MAASLASTKPKAFRQDINGLRAWAVMAVVLYHFGVPGFTGGFIGVDVFFVISGFLMTRIIITGMETGRFSVWQFYMARARRIMPALLILCTALLILGWFWLPSADYQTLSLHAGAAATFVSNIQFLRETGYFDAGAHEKWLLHTWSLSVEWQFYIVLPLIVMVVWRLLGRRGVQVTLCMIGVLSFALAMFALSSLAQSNFALSIIAAEKWVGAAFYILPTRAWEMLAGGLVWWVCRSREIAAPQARVMEATGFILIITAIVSADATLGWPSVYALVPIIGAMLVIAAGRQDSGFTSNFVARRLGASSYSIYLWHWPLVVILSYLGASKNPAMVAAGIALSIVLGELSYRLIENVSSAKLKSLGVKTELVFICAPALLIVVSSYFIYHSGGANTHWRQTASSGPSLYIDKYVVDNYMTPYVKAQYVPECDFGGDAKRTENTRSIAASCTELQNGKTGVFLWGDSHAQALSYGLRQHLKGDVALYQVATSSCRPHLSSDPTIRGEVKAACDQSNEFALREIERLKPELVIMVQRSGHEQNDYAQIIDRLLSLGVQKVVLVGPVPEWQPSLPRTIALRHFSPSEKAFTDNTFERSLRGTDQQMKRVFEHKEGATYISLLDQLCQAEKCLAKVDDSNTPLVWDYGHLSLGGSDFVAREILLKDPVLSGYLQ